MEKKPISNLRIGQYVFLGFLLIFALFNFINSSSNWVASTPGDLPIGRIIGGFLLLVAQLLFALIGFIISAISIYKSKKKNDRSNTKVNLIFLLAFVILPFIFWYINALILEAADLNI